MSTNALISYSENGRVKSVYIHWDGNPKETGRKLNKFFPTMLDAKALVQGGNLSQINADGVPVYYSEYPAQRLLENYKYKIHENNECFNLNAPVDYNGVEHIAEVMLCNKSDGSPWYPETFQENIEYVYVFMKGEWHVTDNGIDFDTVEDEIRYQEKMKQLKQKKQAKEEQKGIWSEFAEQGFAEFHDRYEFAEDDRKGLVL